MTCNNNSHATWANFPSYNIKSVRVVRERYADDCFVNGVGPYLRLNVDDERGAVRVVVVAEVLVEKLVDVRLRLHGDETGVQVGTGTPRGGVRQPRDWHL